MTSEQDGLVSRCIPEPNSGCWLWLGAVNKSGYGYLWTWRGHRSYAHRASYEAFLGEIPEGAHICHKCDNPACINPDHLFLGNPRANAEDRVRKGRQPRGTGIGTSVLSDPQVLEIRRRWADGETQASIAASFGVSSGTVLYIVHRHTWRHIA